MDTFLGLVTRRQLRPLCQAAAAAPPGWLRLSSASPCRDDPSMHTPVPLLASPCLPGSQDHALRFSPAPRGKLAVHYIRNANAGALGRPVPGGHAAAVATRLIGESVRPSPAAWRARWARRDAQRAGQPGAFQGKYRSSPPPSHRALVPPAATLVAPGRQVVCKHLRAWGGERRRSPGCEGRDALCAAGLCVPAALQWQLPSRSLLTLILQCSRS